MNSWLGVLVFLLGLSSTRFRHVLAGTVQSRVTQLQSLCHSLILYIAAKEDPAERDESEKRCINSKIFFIYAI